MKTQGRSVLEGVSPELPELTRAVRLQQCAAHVGFDWTEISPVLAKIREELAELEMEISGHGSPGRKLDELGDLLFAVTNLARKLELDPDLALRGTNRKFQRRFGRVETDLAKRGKRPQDATLAEMDRIWELAKHDES